MTKYKSVVAWKGRNGAGRGRKEELQMNKKLRDDGYAHYLSCGDGFMDVYLSIIYLSGQTR